MMVLFLFLNETALSRGIIYDDLLLTSFLLVIPTHMTSSDYLRIIYWQGWIVLSDKLGPIEKARMLATEIRWEARVIDLQNGSDQRLLVCQKPFVRK